MKISKNEVSQIVKSLYKKKGKPLIGDDLTNAGILYQFKRYYGKRLAEAFKKLDLPSSPLAEKYSISKEILIRYLQELSEKLGYIPSTFDVATDNEVYKKYVTERFSHKIFQNKFEGFPQALQAAGLVVKSGKNTTIKVNIQESTEFNNRRRFWGKGAEMHVIAELLYRGFQPTNISVDEGVDVIGNKNNKTFYFQVKHKDLSNNTPVEITKSTYQNKSGNDYYLVVVLLSKPDDVRRFLIIPWVMIDNWIDKKIVDDNGSKYLLYVKQINDTFKLKDESLDRYLGNKGWDKIK